jgi:phage-related protein
LDTVGEIPEELIRQLSQSLNSILGDINNGTNGLLVVAGGGVLNILSLLATLTNSQLSTLSSTIGQLNQVLTQLTQVLQVTTNLTPEVRNLIQGIITGLQTAIPALLGPLVNFVSVVRSIALFVGLNVSALTNAVSGLVNVVDTLTTSLGLGPLLGNVLKLLNLILS